MQAAGQYSEVSHLDIWPKIDESWNNGDDKRRYIKGFIDDS